MPVGRFQKNGQYYDIAAAGVYDTGLQASQAQINAALKDVTNLFDKTASGIVTGKYIKSDGGISTSGVGSVSDYIPVIPGTVLMIQPSITYSWYCNYYDTFKNLIDTVPLANVETLSLPEDVHFIRITYVTASIDAVVISYKALAAVNTSAFYQFDTADHAIKNIMPDPYFNAFDYGDNWNGNIGAKLIEKQGNVFSFSAGKTNTYRYFSLLSDTLYVSTSNAASTIPEGAFTLQNKLEPHGVYELIVIVGNGSRVGGSYLAIYDKHGNVISQNSISDLLAGQTYRTTFVNDTVPIALCMQSNTKTQTDVGELSIVIRKIRPEYIYSDDTIKKIRSARWTHSETIAPVTLLHFSDIHGNGRQLSKILAFKDAHAALIQDVLCTGDMRLASVKSDFTFWSERDTSKILVSLGNHEYYTSSDDQSKADIPTVIQTWIGDYAANWGVTIDSGASYYYKDYDGGVRLIVLDCNLTNAQGGAAQKDWLSAVLDDAKTNNKAVVIACHYVYVGSSYTYTDIDCSFTNAFYVGTERGSSYDWSPTTYCSAVQNFIDDQNDGRGNGNFVCWLAGHTHRDLMSYPNSYPNQLIVTITSATAKRGNLHLYTGDLDRTENTPTEDAFNLVTVDTANNLLKIVRVGANVNTYMRRRDMICYNYSTHQLIGD